MKGTFVKCENWSWEDKLLYIKACIGDEIPHNKICGNSAYSKDELLDSYKKEAAFIYCCDSGMISYNTSDSYSSPCAKEIKLSDLKPRTRTEYEKVTESIFDLKDEFERGELYIQLLGDSGEYRAIEEESTLIDEMRDDNVYRKVEKPIEWWEDAAEFAKGCNEVEHVICLERGMSVKGMMTRDQWCDFARILLEQEGE